MPDRKKAVSPKKVVVMPAGASYTGSQIRSIRRNYSASPMVAALCDHVEHLQRRIEELSIRLDDLTTHAQVVDAALPADSRVLVVESRRYVEVYAAQDVKVRVAKAKGDAPTRRELGEYAKHLYLAPLQRYSVTLPDDRPVPMYNRVRDVLSDLARAGLDREECDALLDSNLSCYEISQYARLTRTLMEEDNGQRPADGNVQPPRPEVE